MKKRDDDVSLLGKDGADRDQVTFNLGREEKCIFPTYISPFFYGSRRPIVYENQFAEPERFDMLYVNCVPIAEFSVCIRKFISNEFIWAKLVYGGCHHHHLKSAKMFCL